MLIDSVWKPPAGVAHIVTSRWVDGVEFNLGLGPSGNDPDAARNRLRLGESIAPVQLCWLKQEHGVKAVEFVSATKDIPIGDIAYSTRKQLACAVLTADCVPVLLAAEDGSCVAAVHAGWRGLAAGVIEKAASMFAGPFCAYIGAHICRKCYRIGDEVKQQLARKASDGEFFSVAADNGWLADLGGLAKSRLADTRSCTSITDESICTHCSDQCFSARRDGAAAGRFASAIWKI